MTPDFPVAAGRRVHLVQLANPGTPTPDGDGGYIETPAPLTPAAVYADVRPATGRDRERFSAGTSFAVAAYVVTIPFHAQVTTQTQVTHRGRALLVNHVENPDERDVESILYCTEVVP